MIFIEILMWGVVGVGGVIRLRIMPNAAYFKGRCRWVVRLRTLPKAASLEGRCREVVRLSFAPKASHLEGLCRGVVPFRVFTKED